MSVQSCVACSTQYAIGLDACPHCGSTEYEREGVAISRRLPAFASVSCDCGRGPWNIRLSGPLPGLIALPSLFCASCGSQVQVPWPPVEDSMSPKITVHGGATNARDTESSPDVSVSPPLVGAEAGQGHPTPVEAPVETPVEPPAEVDAVQESTESEDAYAGLSLSELRSAADQRGIASYGTKAQITERLREADQSA